MNSYMNGYPYGGGYGYNNYGGYNSDTRQPQRPSRTTNRPVWSDPIGPNPVRPYTGSGDGPTRVPDERPEREDETPFELPPLPPVVPHPDREEEHPEMPSDEH